MKLNSGTCTCLIGAHTRVAWYGLWAPKGTPKPVLDTLNYALQMAIADQNFRSRMADLGALPSTAAQASPDVLRTYLKSEIDSWGAAIKRAGITPE